jgi:hypothetical protein
VPRQGCLASRAILAWSLADAPLEHRTEVVALGETGEQRHALQTELGWRQGQRKPEKRHAYKKRLGRRGWSKGREKSVVAKTPRGEQLAVRLGAMVGIGSAGLRARF